MAKRRPIPVPVSRVHIIEQRPPVPDRKPVPLFLALARDAISTR